jgi:arylsulfatase A-like enzyme
MDQRTDPERPVFLWVHLYDPHHPYKPPKRYRRAVVEEGTREQAAPARYYEEIHFTDSEVGRLLDGLAERGLGDDLVVAVVADHGEMLGEKGRRPGTHSPVLFETTIRVPLLLRIPHDWSPGEVSAQVSIVDLAPTLLEAAGVLPTVPLSGKSLYGLVGGEAEPDRMAYSETFYEHFPKRAPDGTELRSLRHGGWKLVERPGRTDLFDLRNDPDENRNLAASRPDKLAEMRSSLAALRSGWKTVDRGALEIEDDEMEAHTERLRALGYVE